MVLVAQNLGVPKALGLTTREWVQDRIGGYVQLNVPERREAVAELKEAGLSTRETGDVLGVDHETIRRDLTTGANAPSQVADTGANAPLVFQDEVSKQAARFGGLTGEIEWYTPREYLDAAIEVMGAIDLDPASSDLAQQHVKAKRYFTRETDGLKQRWSGRVFLNPPYAMPFVKDFVEKMVTSFEAGDISQGILLTNNATDTEWWHRADRTCSALCFTRGRISFLKAKDGVIEKKEAPTNGQVFFYFGPNVEAFRQIFKGAVHPPPWS
jgi:ParB family chromosome partitioning protein